jgi:nucleoside-diphosphate-sugar epimerase
MTLPQSKRIVFRDGSGVVASHVKEKLLSCGHEILSVDATTPIYIP